MDDQIKALFAAAADVPSVAAVDQSDTQTNAKSTVPDVKNAMQKRAGAPLGNTNATKHGLRSGKFPPGTEYLTKEITRFRKLVSAAIVEIHGELGFAHAALLQTSLEHYSHALRVRRWLRVGWQELTTEQVLVFSREIGRAMDARDKVLKQLGIDARTDEDSKRTLYTLPALPADDAEGQTNAPENPAPA